MVKTEREREKKKKKKKKKRCDFKSNSMWLKIQQQL